MYSRNISFTITGIPATLPEFLISRNSITSVSLFNFSFRRNLYYNGFEKHEHVKDDNYNKNNNNINNNNTYYIIKINFVP